MKRVAVVALLLIATPATAGDKALAAAADVVITGRVIGIGFSTDGEQAAIRIEDVQKGYPVIPLKMLIDATARKTGCCVAGARYRMYLKGRGNGFYSAVDGRSIVRLAD